jgi:putative thioredoxin
LDHEVDAMETLIGQGGGAAQPNPGDLIKDSNIQTFMADVIEASREVPVIVDFWAPWCGPCKTLGPMLERQVLAAKGAVKMVKVDIDQNQEIARQMRIQSIPAVYAFHNGQPVDGFVGAVSESQVKSFVQRLAAMGGPTDAQAQIDELLAAAAEALAEGDLQQAGGIYQELVGYDPSLAAAQAGLARVALAAGGADGPARAEEVLAQVPAEIANHADIASVRAAIALAAEGAKAAGARAGLEARLAQNPADHQARFDLALAKLGAGDREGAVDELLAIVRKDRKWNDEAARVQLVKMFEAFGPTDPLTIDARRRLSSILFS